MLDSFTPKQREVVMHLLANLTAAASAYRRHASRSKHVRPCCSARERTAVTKARKLLELP